VRLLDRLAATGKRFYCVCFTVRSGSTLLCEDLAQWGLGAPAEDFQVLPEVYSNDSVADYVVRTVEQSPGELFGFKISLEQAITLSERLRDEGESDVSIDLRSIFPDLRHLRIVRSDKIAQAVSTWRARFSGVWHRPVGTMVDPGRPEYDFEAIRGELYWLIAEDWLWSFHCENLAIPTFLVEYESYLGAREGTLASIAGYLNAGPKRSGVVDRLQVLRDEWSQTIVERVQRDLYALR
jgi:LPS sulfotransferase NodH